MLRILSEKKKRLFYTQQALTERTVLVETNAQGEKVGFTENYVKAQLPQEVEVNQMIKINLQQIKANDLIYHAEIIESSVPL